MIYRQNALNSYTWNILLDPPLVRWPPLSVVIKKTK